MREGVRIKNPLIRNSDLGVIEKVFKDAGFEVTGSERTARAVTVFFKESFPSNRLVHGEGAAGHVCCTYPGEIKVSDSGVILRWSGISSRQYYHLNSQHQGELHALEAKALAAWAQFESKA